MVGKSPTTADGEQACGAGERWRIRATVARRIMRAMLLTLLGWTSPRIAEAFGVREDTVRLVALRFRRRRRCR